MSPRVIAPRIVFMEMTPPSSGSSTASASVIRPSAFGFVDRFGGVVPGSFSSSASIFADSESAQMKGMNPSSMLVIFI